MSDLLWMNCDTKFLRDISRLQHFDLMLNCLMACATFVHFDARDQGFAVNWLQRVTQDTFRGHWQWIDGGLVEGLPQNCLVLLPIIGIGSCYIQRHAQGRRRGLNIVLLSCSWSLVIDARNWSAFSCSNWAIHIARAVVYSWWFHS